jgi:protein-tyrosine phosphatase
MRILMVCLGNICRSPIAEGVLRHKIEQNGLDWTVESAGTNSYHTGEPPHKHSQKVCKLNGVDISAQRARRFRADDFEKYNKIYVMAEDVYDDVLHIAGNKVNKEKLDYFLHELEADSNGSVPDPWYGTEEGYAPVYELIERTCEAIINKYK